MTATRPSATSADSRSAMSRRDGIAAAHGSSLESRAATGGVAPSGRSAAATSMTGTGVR